MFFDLKIIDSLIAMVSMSVFFYGVYLLIIHRKWHVKAISFIAFGGVCTSLMVYFSFVNYDVFSKISFDHNFIHKQKFIEYALNENVDVEFRLFSATEVYLKSGKIVTYLDSTGAVTVFSPTPVNIEKRRETENKENLAMENISSKLKYVKLTLAVTTVTALFWLILIALKVRKKSLQHSAK